MYLPPCYDTQVERFYPVLYLVPGRGSGPTAWFAAGADKAADKAILEDGIPPFVIVVTENTDSDQFAEAIVSDLIPFIESHYRILQDRDHRAVAGGSLGGIAAYRIAFQHPDQFASAALFGSGLISGEEAQFETWLDAIPPENQPRVFFNTGEQDPYLLERARVMASILDRHGVENTMVVSEGGHDSVYWVSNFPAYFSWLARDW
jgi:enterochelin esterase-like enzyme